MSCGRYEGLIQDYLDQNISEEELKELNDHIRTCSDCRNELEDMIQIVSVVEDMAVIHMEKERQKKKRFSNKLLTTCVAVCSAVIFTFYYPIEINRNDQAIEYMNFVVAEESESLPIPSSKEVVLIRPHKRGVKLSERELNNAHVTSVTWVYPSSYSYLGEIKKQLTSDHYIFINVPDKKTLEEISISFIGSLPLLEEIKEEEFPISVAFVKNEAKPIVKSFHFPNHQDEINQLFQHQPNFSYQALLH